MYLKKKIHITVNNEVCILYFTKEKLHKSSKTYVHQLILPLFHFSTDSVYWNSHRLDNRIGYVVVLIFHIVNKEIVVYEQLQHRKS